MLIHILLASRQTETSCIRASTSQKSCVKSLDISKHFFSGQYLRCVGLLTVFALDLRSVIGTFNSQKLLTYTHIRRGMTSAGILYVLFLLGGCFPFVFFKRKRQRAQDRRKGHVEKGNASTSQRTASDVEKHRLPDQQNKTTRTFCSRASHFSGPQNFSDRDKLWLQAFRYGGR